MIRSNGLASIEYADDRGDTWLEIRPPSSASFRVPFYGYRTHLIRLVVDGHLSFWLEVLGHCVRSGTFRSLTSGGVDPNLVKPLFDLLNGGATVCHGRGSVLKRVHQFHPKAALEHGLAGRNYFTLPDYRYRSYDCLRLIDSRSGATQCAACLRPSEPPLSPLLDGIHVSSALRRPHHHQQNDLHPQQHQDEEQQHHHQQQHHQQKHHYQQHQHVIHPSSFSPSEPLNLSLHHPMTNNIVRPSAEPNKQSSTFLPVTSAYTSTTIYTGGQRLQLDPSSPSAGVNHSPRQAQQHHHHHHHHYRCGSANLDNNPEDYRLAKEAAYLSLTNERDRSRNSCCTDWNVNSGDDCSNDTSIGGQMKRTSLSPRRSQDVGDCYDPDFHTTWIKQETLGSPHNNGS